MSSKLHEVIESAGKKAITVIFKGNIDNSHVPFLSTTCFESHYGKIFYQTEKVICNQISFKITRALKYISIKRGRKGEAAL